MSLDTTSPLKRFLTGLFVLFAVPLLPAILWAHAQYRRLVEWRAPDCPVCGDTMGHVANVGYVCEREGCAAYGDELNRARAREADR